MAEENQDDWLSKLPGEVLLNIVERLGIADAARTSILSGRWKQIPAMLSKIVITVDPFERKHKRRKLTDDDDDDDMVRANTPVLEATKSILKRRAESVCTIHLLSVGFYLGDESIFIGHAVANTIATQKVASVEFAILTKVRRRCTNNDMLTYGRQFMTFFDSCPNTFGGLARLSLENLRSGESDFPKIFTICKQLEFLYIYRCDMGIMSLLEVEHPQLRELVIAFINLNRVDLKWVPKLTMVKFNVFISQHDPFCLGYVPLLQTVSIINMGRSWQKMLNLSELLGKTAISNLHLDFKCEKIWVKPEGRRQLLPVFHKLKVVNLINISEECDLTWTMFILQGAPSLKELGVMVLNHWCGMILGKRRKMYNFSEEKDKGLEWEPSASDFKHHGLAELRICGRFKGEEKIASYARCVMEAAVNLEDIKVYNNPACENRKHKVSKEWTRKQKLSLRNKITEGMSSLVRIHFPGIGQAFPWTKNDLALQAAVERNCCKKF